MKIGGFIKDLRFAEGYILVEQLRLLLVNAATMTIPVVVLSTMVAVTLSNENTAIALYLWAGILMISKVAAYYLTLPYRVATMPLADGRKIAWLMIAFFAFDGLAWGALPWIALDGATPDNRVIILVLMTGVVGSGMAQSYQVLGVFTAFATLTTGLVLFKLLFMDFPLYTMSVAAVIYLFSLLSLAQNNAASSLAAITLNFDNIELLKQLRIKSEAAECARREAEQANQAKSKFLAAASHDLRQPVHAQGLFLSVLSSTTLSTQQRELVENIRKSSAASSDMLNTLLDFSRIEAGVIRPQVQAIHLQPLLHKLEAELAPQAEAKGIRYRSRETLLAVHSDEALLELILRNLISNAIRYTDHGGVLIGCRRRGKSVVLEVWDSGIGIDPAQQQEVFREFHQLGNPERDSRKGLGLGLAIAEGLSKTLGHTITMVSTPERGSVFRLAMESADATVRIEEPYLMQPVRAALNACVLVIDDEEAVRIGMSHLLWEWGCECHTAETIEEALEITKTWVPDVIVSDYRLREQRTGGEAISSLRAQLGSNIPALLITGDTAPERLREAEASGVPLLHKPVPENKLYLNLLAVLKNRKG